MRTGGADATTHTLGAFRRRVALVAEVLLLLAIGGSVAAIGAVHAWAYVPLWGVAAAAGACAAMLWVADGPLEHAAERPPLLRPGAVLLVWVLTQVVPLPPRFHSTSVSVPDTLRGVCFVAAALSLHAAAGRVFNRHAPRARLRRILTVLGTVLALGGLLQAALGTPRIYGFFEPLEGGFNAFGPFVNRNHFAGYMLLVAPVCLGLAAATLEKVSRLAGARGLRGWLLALGSPAGTTFLLGAMASLATMAALIATGSRAALICLVGGLAVAATATRARRPLVLPVLMLLVGLSWAGPERVARRLGRVPEDSAHRTRLWSDTMERMGWYWVHGSGFNTFAVAMSGATPWRLPRGATPWPAELAADVDAGIVAGVRTPPWLPGTQWYREAHNDYLQLLVEVGVPGLAIALWGAARVVARARQQPWLLTALVALLLHEMVDFDLQVPAVAALASVLAALPSPGRPEDPASVSGPRTERHACA